MSIAAEILLLLVAFQLKHLLADYVWQTPWMLGKFKAKGWAAPLAAHAGVHACLTFLIVGVFTLSRRWPLHPALALAAFDFVVHFAMDRVKASPRLMGRWKALSAKEYQEATAADDPSWTWVDAYVEAMTTTKESLKERPLSRTREIIMARSKLRGNQLFWLSLGFDQMAHHLTHYAIIAALALS